MRYTISEMAALLGVTTHTLRYYEKMGLIQPEVNRETGYRYYTVTDTRRFNLCRELRAAGFTLEECKDFLDEPSTAVTDAMLIRLSTCRRSSCRICRSSMASVTAVEGAQPDEHPLFAKDAGVLPYAGAGRRAGVDAELPGNVAAGALAGGRSPQ